VKDILAVLLAGGQSRRMGGGDKCLIELGGKPLLTHVIERTVHQVAGMVISANGDPARFSDFGFPVLADTVEGFAGPLAGILTVLEWAAANRNDCDWVASIPTDSPFLPRDLVARMAAAVIAEDANLAGAMSGGRTHPICGLWRVDLAPELRCALVDEDVRKIDAWTARYRLAKVEFSTDPLDPFFNINRPEDLAEAERLLTSA
jgi:molybdopterin-guanine dinucleotide biosynthesis protein A